MVSMEQAESPFKIPFGFFGFENAINALTVSWFVTLLLFALFFITRGRLKQVPTGLQNFFEMIVDLVQNLAEPIVGRHAAFFFPLFFYLFVFIFFSNLMGLIPGFMSPTSRVDVNVGMALIVFFSTHVWGIKEKGVLKYLAHFLPPPIKVDPSSGIVLKVVMKTIYVLLCLMLPVIHLMGELVKPVSLTMRLFGNIMGKEKILAVSIVLMMAFWGDTLISRFFSVMPGLLRVVIVVLGVLVSFLQAFVFMLLAMVFIGGAVQEHEHEENPAGEAAHG